MNIETLPDRIFESEALKIARRRHLKYIFSYETYYLGKSIRSLQLKRGYRNGYGPDETPAYKHFIYRHYDKNDNLLYVGISLSAISRLSSHKNSSPWFHKISSVKIEGCESKASAIQKEKEAIKKERPMYNISHSVI